MKRKNFVIASVAILALSVAAIVIANENPFGEVNATGGLSEKTVLVVDPCSYEGVDILDYILGRDNTFWADFETSFSDVDVICMSPTDDLSTKISSYSPDVIVISDANIKLWELNENDNYEPLKDFTDDGGGLVITHGSFFDLVIDTQSGDNLCIGPNKHSGLQDDYSVEFEGLCTQTGLGLLPIYEQMKVLIANAVESAGHPEVATPIRSIPLNIPYVPFNGIFEVENSSDPLLDDIPLSNNQFSVDMNCPMCKGSGELGLDFDCWLCEGTGNINGETCPLCHGHGHFGEFCLACDGTGILIEGEECLICDGTGNCTVCNGTGKVDCPNPLCEDGKVDCSLCGGTGKVDCSLCGGTGKVDCPNPLCEDGKVECVFCQGDGCIMCSYRGWNGCLLCGGNGADEAGRGWIGCGACGGFGGTKGRGWNGCLLCGGNGADEAGRGWIGCGACGGFGGTKGRGWNGCLLCGGFGGTPGSGECSFCGGDGYLIDSIPCPFCDGDGIPDSYECFYCGGTGGAPYTMVGWQLKYPEVIAIQGLENIELVINEISELFSPIVSEYNRLVEGILPLVGGQSVKESMLEGSQDLKEFFQSMLEARSNLPNITIQLPEITIGNYTLPEGEVNITLPDEIAEKVCSILKPAEIVATSTDGRAAILKYESSTHRSVYFTFKPEATPNDVNIQLMYNAINWSSISPPEPPMIGDMVVPQEVKNGYDDLQGQYSNFSDIFNTTGFVTENGSSTFDFAIHSSGTLAGILTHPSGDIQFRFISPNGTEYNSTADSGGNELVEVQNPESGVWNVKIEANSTESAIYELYRMEIKEEYVDTTPPDASSAHVEIEGGLAYFNDTSLEFIWSGFVDDESGIAGYYYSFQDNSGTPDGIWTNSTYGQLSGAPEGVVTVYVWARDNAGNIGSAVFDSIVVDMTPPDASSAVVIIENGAEYTNQTTLEFFWGGFTSLSPISLYYYSFINNEGTSNGTPSCGKYGQLSGAPEGVVFVYVWAQDMAGNIGLSASDTIIVIIGEPPIADFTYSPLNPEVYEPIIFDASSSYDSDGNITSYEWDWNDDGTYDDTGLTATHSWSFPGSYPVTLRVTDNNGTMDTKTEIVPVGIADIYVDDDFDNSTPRWHINKWAVIQNAIDNASDGDIVFVYNGTYYENVVVNKMINLVGEDRNTTIIDGGGSGNVLNIKADLVKISGFTIQNGKNSSSGIKIRSNQTTIYNNVVKDNYNGIYIGYWSGNHYITFNDNNISNNIICNNSMDGIQMGGRNNSVIGNYITNNSAYGIEKWGSQSNICGNIIVGNGRGILLCNSANNNTIERNTITDSYDGIQLGSNRYNIITKNIISNNNYGIEQSPSTSNNDVICNNVIEGNGHGIYLYYDSWGYEIYHNNFINNSQNAYDEGNNTWDNDYPSGGNYWDDFDEPSEGAYDNNSDGIVDSPYDIPGGSNQDLYPLMYPFGSKTVVSVIPFSKVIHAEKSFTINITVDPTEPIAGVQFDLYFNSSLLIANSVTEGDLFAGHSTYFDDGAIDNTNGTITGVVGLAIMGNTSASGTFAIINFTAKTTDGTSPLNLSNVVVGNPNGMAVAIEVNNGNVTVRLYPWDVNMDDSVNILDLIIVGQHWGETGEPGWIRADVNKDGVINILDLILIGQHWTG